VAKHIRTSLEALRGTETHIEIWGTHVAQLLRQNTRPLLVLVLCLYDERERYMTDGMSSKVERDQFERNLKTLVQGEPAVSFKQHNR